MAARKRNGSQNSPTWLPSGRGASPPFGLRYPLSVALLAALLFAIYFYPYAENSAMAVGIQTYLAAYAKMVRMVISIVDSHVVVSGNRIDGRTFSMSIVKTCDAMEVNILLAASLAGFPMPLLRRLVSVVASVLALVLMNIVRLCALFWLGAHAPAWFDRAHQTLAPLFMVACALAIFLVATARMRRTLPGTPVDSDATS